MVDETGLEEPKLDEMAVGKIAVDEPGPHQLHLAQLVSSSNVLRGIHAYLPYTSSILDTRNL